MLITSASNPKVQRLQKLLQKKKVRHNVGLFVAEGVRLVEEALKWGVIPVELYWGEEISDRGQELVDAFLPKVEFAYHLSDQLMRKVAGTNTTQGVLGVFTISSVFPTHPQFLLVADQIRDPGNLGTLMRSAKAMGVDGIITTPGTVDVYSPKVVRSAMGVHFSIPVCKYSWDGIAAKFPRREVTFWTTVVDGGEPIISESPKFPIALVVGGEADGVSAEALTRSDVDITIPMRGNTESLNAGVAGSIALYEIMKKRIEEKNTILPG